MKCFKLLAAALLAVPSALAQDTTVSPDFQPATLSTADARNTLLQAGTCVSLPVSSGHHLKSYPVSLHIANISFSARRCRSCWEQAELAMLAMLRMPRR